MRQKKVNKVTSLVIAASLILMMIPLSAAPVIAAEPGTYNAGDVAVINNIIDNNGLGWTKAEPADGSYIPDDWYLMVTAYRLSWSDDIMDKRVVLLGLQEDPLYGTLDVSGLDHLHTLFCTSGELVGLADLPDSLLDLTIIDNQLTSMPHLPSGLLSLICSGNRLTSLDIAHLDDLEYLDCSNNYLVEILLSASNTSFFAIDVRYNYLASYASIVGPDIPWDEDGEGAFFLFSPQREAPLYHPGDIAVINRIIENNGLGWTPADPADGSNVPNDWQLDVTWSDDDAGKRIVGLNVSFRQLNGTLDVSGLDYLEDLNCARNQLTALDVSGLVNLVYLNCHSNQLTELDVSGLDNLEELHCYFNQLTALDVSGLGNLKYLYCYSNQLTELDVSGLINLAILSCYNNQLTALHVSGLTKLMHLTCYGNQLTELDVSWLVNLVNLFCFDNHLTELDVSGLVNLVFLYCEYNRLTELDVRGLDNLKKFDCAMNRLTELDVRGLDNLENLRCSSNSMTSLNVSGLNNLEVLDCNGNRLTELDVRGLDNLEVLYCKSNRLSELDVSGLSSLMVLDCSDNHLTVLELSETASYSYINVTYNRIPNKLSVWGNDIDWDGESFEFWPQRSGTYSSNDIIIINNIINNNGYNLTPAYPDDGSYIPDDWYSVMQSLGIQWSSDIMDKRVVALGLQGTPLSGTLDVSGLDHMHTLFCNSGELEGLADLPNGLMELTIIDNHLTSMPPLPPGLQHLNCSGNWLTSLDASNLDDLEILVCSNNYLEEIFLSTSNDSFVAIDVRLNYLESYESIIGPDIPWDVDGEESLFLFSPQREYAQYHPNDIAVINDMIRNNGLGWSLADPEDGSQVPDDWTGIIWSDDEALKRVVSLDVNDCGLTGALTVSGLAKLEYLNCQGNGLGAIDVRGLINLEYLNCSENNLTELDASGLVNLHELVCFLSQLTSLNVSGLSNLEHLDCGNAYGFEGSRSIVHPNEFEYGENQISELDVSQLDNLDYLDCSGNLLTTLELSFIAPYSYIDVRYNIMESPASITGREIQWDEGSFLFSPQRTLDTGVIIVTFNANGGSTPEPLSKAVVLGEPYGELATTTMVGYEFLGWFVNESDEEITKDTIVTNPEDHTLYALWEAIPLVHDLVEVFDSSYSSSYSGTGGNARGTINHTFTFTTSEGLIIEKDETRMDIAEGTIDYSYDYTIGCNTITVLVSVDTTRSGDDLAFAVTITPLIDDPVATYIIVEPTCMEDGLMVSRCAVCKMEFDEVIITGFHSWGSWSVVEPATCTTEGEEKRVCGFNEEHIDTRPIPIDPNAHDWGDWSETTSATCETEGEETRVCAHDNSHVETNTIEALGHAWGGAWLVTIPATCSAEGEETRVCERNAEHIDICPIPIDPNAHDWGDWVETTHGTCMEPGVETRTCNHNAAHMETQLGAIDPSAHAWGAWSVTTHPTCSAEGEESRICEYNAEHIDTRPIAIDPNAHDWGDWVETTPGTCMAPGVETRTCKHNGAHNETQPGVIDPNAHAWSAWSVTTPATCSHPGVETRVCGHNATHSETQPVDIDPNAHDWGAWVVTTHATVTTAGVETRTCNHNAEHTETRAIPALGDGPPIVIGPTDPDSTDIGDQTIAITSPATGEAAQSTIAPGAEYTGTITWYNVSDSTDHTGTFLGGKKYMATVILTADDEHKWPNPAPEIVVVGQEVESVKVNGTSLGNTLSFTVTFAETVEEDKPLPIIPDYWPDPEDQEYVDIGLIIIEYVGFDFEGIRLLTSYDDELFWIGSVDTEINTDNLIAVYFNGDLLKRNIDYYAEDGSVKITIRAQTFERYGEGEHTIAAVFSINEELKVAAQKVTVELLDADVALIGFNLFSDVNMSHWFYNYVKWAYESKYMVGVGNGKFAPKTATSEAMVTAVLARLGRVDLSQYTVDSAGGIDSGRWFSLTATWAKTSGLLGDRAFSPNSAITRGELAVILVRFLDYLEIDYSTPATIVEFADADEMTAEENDAFQILCNLGIFEGVGGNRMVPQGQTSRAQLAALLLRLNDLVG